MIDKKRQVFGSLETARIENIDIDIVAKIDTGAWSGALHCTDISEVDGVLWFTPLGIDRFRMSTKDYEVRDVRAAHGDVKQRYLVSLTFVIRDKKYRSTIGLSDRTLMRREMLLGRKFLIDNNILVDVLLTLEDDHEAEMFL